MAIDTLAKRVSAMGEVLPIPDATINQADRQTVVSVYGGILASAAVAVINCLTRDLVRPVTRSLKRVYTRCLE